MLYSIGLIDYCDLYGKAFTKISIVALQRRVSCYTQMLYNEDPAATEKITNSS